MNILQRSWQHVHDHFVPVAGNNYKPHIIGHRSMHLYAGFLISVKLASLFSLDLVPENRAYSSAITVPNIIALTNASRANYGIGGLQENSLLDSAAQAKAEDMLAHQYFAHTSPQGRTPWDFISAQKYNYIIAGENLAINFSSAESVEDAWMNSPGHKANILNADYQDIGIGISQGEYNGINAIFVVQMFGTRIDQPLIPQNQYTTPLPRVQLAPTPPGHKDLVQTAVAAKLPMPTFDAPSYYLTNRKDVVVSGKAPGATNVSISVNGQPAELLPVSQGLFKGTVTLNEGVNTLTALSTSSTTDSPVSQPISFKLDTVAPVVVSSSLQPVRDSSNSIVAYKLQATVSGDPVKVVASLGPNNVMLTPAAAGNLWTATLAAGQLTGDVSLLAYDLAGNRSVSPLASFENSVLGSYGFAASNDYKVNMLGFNVSSSAVHNIYLYFALGIILSMLFALAIKRKVYHVTTFAHASALAVLAIFLWVT